MSIGQGDLIVSPLQMAVSYAALINGGRVLEPRVGAGLGLPQPDGTEKVVRDFKKVVAGKLPLDATEMAVLRRGLEDAVMGPSGTARSAFSGFPLSRFPIAGKTGTAQIGRVDSGLNFAWFVSYAPATDPDYVIAVYLEQAGHGGESAAPIARRIYEGIFGVLNRNDVRLAEDRSG
jgi:penicillin-binding protein 2